MVTTSKHARERIDIRMKTNVSEVEKILADKLYVELGKKGSTRYLLFFSEVEHDLRIALLDERTEKVITVLFLRYRLPPQVRRPTEADKRNAREKYACRKLGISSVPNGGRGRFVTFSFKEMGREKILYRHPDAVSLQEVLGNTTPFTLMKYLKDFIHELFEKVAAESGVPLASLRCIASVRRRDDILREDRNFTLQHDTPTSRKEQERMVRKKVNALAKKRKKRP